MIVDIKVAKIGSSYMAGTVLGGVVLRGRKADDKAKAVRNLLWKLAGQDGEDDPLIAVELAVEGTTLSEQLALGDGGGDSE